MKTKNIKKNQNHISGENLVKFYYNFDINEEKRTKIKNHLLVCDTCLQKFEQVIKICEKKVSKKDRLKVRNLIKNGKLKISYEELQKYLKEIQISKEKTWANLKIKNKDIIDQISQNIVKPTFPGRENTFTSICQTLILLPKGTGIKRKAELSAALGLADTEAEFVDSPLMKLALTITNAIKEINENDNFEKAEKKLIINAKMNNLEPDILKELISFLKKLYNR